MNAFLNADIDWEKVKERNEIDACSYVYTQQIYKIEKWTRINEVEEENEEDFLWEYIYIYSSFFFNRRDVQDMIDWYETNCRYN